MWSIYNKITGCIEKIVSCPASMVRLQFDPATHGALKGSFSENGYYVDSETPVEMPFKPSSHHTFDYITKQWIDPRTPETEWPLVRAERNRLLQVSDWTQLPDVPLTTKEPWAAYRQALRDVTLQLDPFSIVWPAAPG